MLWGQSESQLPPCTDPSLHPASCPRPTLVSHAGLDADPGSLRSSMILYFGVKLPLISTDQLPFIQQCLSLTR